MSLLYFGIGRSLFVGHHPDPEMHSHATLQITASLLGEFQVRTKRLPWTTTRGAVFAPDTPHQFRGLSGAGVTLHVIPEARLAVRLAETCLADREIVFPEPSALTRYLKVFSEAGGATPGCSEVFLAGERLIEELAGSQGWRGVVDERILAALDRIEAILPRQISLKTIARHVCLSEDRLLHLFTEQLGLPLRPYVLNQRIMRATAEILEGRSITQAAICAGFCDTAHFSRTFLRLTGLKPSIVKQYRGTVTVSSCMSSRCIRPTVQDPTGERCHSCVLHRPLPLH